MRTRYAPLLIALALIASIAAPLLLGGLSALNGIGMLAPGAVVLIAALTLSSWLARAAKLWTLTRRLEIALPAPTALAISLATDFAFLTTPGGVGGYAANILLLRRAGATASAATAVAAADQIVDAAFFAIALPIAALLALGSAAP
ncbi:MAG: lysylphosphatidylglycerol synthase domain-containing protein, partial [Dokdonella sp.]